MKLAGWIAPFRVRGARLAELSIMVTRTALTGEWKTFADMEKIRKPLPYQAYFRGRLRAIGG